MLWYNLISYNIMAACLGANVILCPPPPPPAPAPATAKKCCAGKRCCKPIRYIFIYLEFISSTLRRPPLETLHTHTHTQEHNFGGAQFPTCRHVCRLFRTAFGRQWFLAIFYAEFKVPPKSTYHTNEASASYDLCAQRCTRADANVCAKMRPKLSEQ